MSRIAIDMTSTPRNKTGIGRYIKNLVEHLSLIDKENDYFLFTHDDDIHDYDIQASNFNIIPVNSKILRKTYLRIIWEQTVLPIRLKKLDIDIILSPNFTTPYLAKAKKICVFHDLTYFFLPEMHTTLKRELFKSYIRLSSRVASSVITISESSKSDIVKYFPNLESITTVTPLGAAESFARESQNITDIINKYQLPEKYILYVGTIEPRKNVLNLIKAYECLPSTIKTEYKLVLVGKKGWLFEETFSHYENSDDKDNIIFPGFIEEEDLPQLFKQASLFTYISFYEGFGIPLIESMACNTPIITSNTSSMKEIGINASLLVDPHNTSDISKAIEQLLTQSDLREKHLSAFPEKLAYYNWENCAKITLDVIKNVQKEL